MIGLMTSCAIENDIPYPSVEAAISSIEVEGQRAAEGESNAAAVIDNTARTVTLYVNDSVDLSRLKITRLVLNPREAEIRVDSAACVDPKHFPATDFASLDSLPKSANTRMDFTKPVNFTLTKYQDYVWKVTVTQLIERAVDVVGMSDYVLDEDSRNVVIYVGKDQDLKNIRINKLDLGGAYGEVSPDPSTVTDFTSAQVFYARRSGEETWQKWSVFVYTTDAGTSDSSEAFAMVTRATVSGKVRSGAALTVEYREQGASSWSQVPASGVSVSGTSFTATLTGLRGSTTYQYRVSVDGVAGSENSFTTAEAVKLTNGGFEDWSQSGSQWNPWPEGGTSFWGTGNPGAAAFIGNLTTPTDESVSGRAALLESKNALIKLGAGNIFTGDFELDGTNGRLHFGRSFTSFPTALRLYYKYTSATINRIGDEVGSLENLRGRADSCHVYIALSDKSEPYEIRTRPSTRQLFDKNDRNIIAYGEYVSGTTTTSYQQITIPLEYRAFNRTPRYIIIVASASKYGDYFIGGEGSTLWVDEMELVYE